MNTTPDALADDPEFMERLGRYKRLEQILEENPVQLLIQYIDVQGFHQMLKDVNVLADKCPSPPERG